jgi:rhodanese-related sulfurtransferase
VALTLKNHGIHRVRPLDGGLEAWVARGYPVEMIVT